MELLKEHARLILKASSLIAGVAMLFAGISVIVSAPFHYGGLVYTFGALYAVVFGLLILVVEIKDKTRIVSIAYDWVDTYLKFLTLQRGKGAFFMGIGILVFFIWPEGDQGRLVWGVNNVSALMLAIVGGVHVSRVVKEESSPLGISASKLEGEFSKTTLKGPATMHDDDL